MSTAIIWFRQDLRCNLNPAFTDACNMHDVVIPLYINDDATENLGGAQKWWLHHSLIALNQALEKLGLNLILRRGDALEQLQKLITEYNVTAIYWNRCYELQLIARDTTIKDALKKQGISVLSSNGFLLNEPWTIKNKSGNFYKVFTPYWRHCLQHTVTPNFAVTHNTPQRLNIPSDHIDTWKLLHLSPYWAANFHLYWEPGEQGALKKLESFVQNHLKGYKENRNFPAHNATSKLSPHLHFGEISPWQIWHTMQKAKLDIHANFNAIDNFLSELGWREFSYHLLYHFPALPHSNFRSEFDCFPWQQDKLKLKQWQKSKTGYPIVDAGMRELWQTGFMQNRVRMIVASFLTKDLFIDWRHGAAWFLDTLLDADLASNSAGWQWVSGSGADAAPYFRIFNPVLQSEKFDPKGEYIRQWVPELASLSNQWIHKPWEAPLEELSICLGKDYPYPIVDHSVTRDKALSYYKSLNKDDK